MSGSIVRMNADGTHDILNDPLSIEEPLEIRIGTKPFVVTMRTPGNDKELAAGFLATEGIIDNPLQIKELAHCKLAAFPENTVQVRLSEGIDSSKIVSERYGAISASCGICGKMAIESVSRALSEINSKLTVQRSTLLTLPESLAEKQSDFLHTGGLHAAALFREDGELVCLREDVGRHNAVDKALGYAFQQSMWPLTEYIMMVSGRLSFEIVQKSLAAGIPILVAVSAPSSLAVSLAREKGQTLVGFLRPPTLNIYSHPQRIL